MRGPARNRSVRSFSPEMVHSLPTAKLAYFHQMMTTAVKCYGSTDSRQGMSQDKVGAGFDLGRLSFSCCLCVCWPMLLARHEIVHDTLSFSKTNYNEFCKTTQRKMVASKT